MARRAKNHGAGPKFTVGLETKLLGLLDEPCALARKYLAPKFDTVLSFNEGTCIRHEYRKQMNYRYINPEFNPKQYWGQLTHVLEPIPTCDRRYNFYLELVEDSNGKLSSFMFKLEVL